MSHTIQQSEHKLTSAQLALSFACVILTSLMLVAATTLNAKPSKKNNAAKTKPVPAALGSKEKPVALTEFVYTERRR
jgi:hypothetical protein